MKLVQMLLPVMSSSTDHKVGYEQILHELTERFGGATAFSASPAEGLWDDAGERTHDRIITVEVMVEEFDLAWWREYRAYLEDAFKQKEVVVRAMYIIKV